MGEAENRFGVAVGIGRMDVTFDDIITHQAINDIGTFPVGGTDHQRMPQKMTFIYKSVSTHALTLPKILEGTASMQGFATHLKFLAITGRMELIDLTSIQVGQAHLIHRLQHLIIGCADILQ